MRPLTYHEALLSALAGKTVIILPTGANPRYLTFGVMKYHPCALPLPTTISRRISTFAGEKVIEEKPTHKDMVEAYGDIKRSILSAFAGEPGVSHSRVTPWLVE